MPKLLRRLLSSLSKGTKAQLQRENRYLKLENEILRSKLKCRVVVSPEDRARLVRFGREVGAALRKLVTIVEYATFQRWLREAAPTAKAIGKRSGRPPKGQSVKDLVIRLATENPGWGYQRISGELRKLEVSCCSNTVKAILEEAGIGPQPGRRKNSGSTTWNEFTRIHANSIVAADFLTKEVWTLAGKMTAYVLFFIHLGSRKVHVCPPTYSPDGAWVAQQARNFSMATQGWPEKPDMRYLIVDRDTKFTEHFKGILKSDGLRYVQIPRKAPDCNAYAEAWVASLKRECLDYFSCFGLGHLQHVLKGYETFHNRFRPHQRKGNRPLAPLPKGKGEVKRQEFLGGLLNHYYREAG
jgi:putative transposase